MTILDALLHGHRYTTATDAEAAVLDQHHDTHAGPTIDALLMQAWQARDMLPPDDKRAGWDVLIDRLLDLDLSVTSYDQTVDLLHHVMFPPLRSHLRFERRHDATTVAVVAVVSARGMRQGSRIARQSWPRRGGWATPVPTAGPLLNSGRSLSTCPETCLRMVWRPDGRRLTDRPANDCQHVLGPLNT